MSEADPGYGPERFPIAENIEQTEPQRLPDVIPTAAEAACDEDRDDLDTDTEDDSDVELADGNEIDGLSDEK